MWETVYTERLGEPEVSEVGNATVLFRVVWAEVREGEKKWDIKVTLPERTKIGVSDLW